MEPTAENWCQLPVPVCPFFPRVDLLGNLKGCPSSIHLTPAPILSCQLKAEVTEAARTALTPGNIIASSSSELNAFMVMKEHRSKSIYKPETMAILLGGCQRARYSLLSSALGL